jgi:hypothetical protein
MRIDYYKKINQFRRIYVKDQSIANAISVLTKKKTLSKAHMKALKTLGHELNEVDESLTQTP